MRADLIEIALIALLLTSVGIICAHNAWHAAAPERAAPTPKLPESGEGRTSFLAICAIASGSLFVIAIIFNAIALALVPACAIG